MTTANLVGEKLSKNALQIHLVGTLDELNAHLGLIKVKAPNDKDKNFLEAIQINLMRLMSHVSDVSNEKFRFTEEDTAELEKAIDSLKAELPKDLKFVLPGKNEAEAFVHIARTVARRAERYYSAVNEQITKQSNGMLCPYAASYLNKLSDYLYYFTQGVTT